METEGEPEKLKEEDHIHQHSMDLQKGIMDISSLEH